MLRLLRHWLASSAAFIIGTIEILGTLSDEIHLHGAFWNLVTGVQHQPGRVLHRQACSSWSGRRR